MRTFSVHNLPQGARLGASLVVIGVSTASLLSAPLAVGAEAATPSSACTAMTHDKFLDAVSVSVTAKAIVITGHKAKFHCGGEDDGHYNVKKKTTTFTINSKAVVKVFRNKETGARYRTIEAKHLPRALKKNSDEPVYEYKGARTNVKKLVEEFHP